MQFDLLIVSITDSTALKPDVLVQKTNVSIIYAGIFAFFNHLNALHSKKISSIRNPQKRFGRFEIACK